MRQLLLIIGCLAMATPCSASPAQEAIATRVQVIGIHGPRPLKAPASVSAVSERGQTKTDSLLLFLPHFRLDTSDPFGGLTTLFAVQGNSSTTQIEIDYLGFNGQLLLGEEYTLAPNAVLTVNIRDKNFAPNAGPGRVAGAVAITSDQPINGDFFFVDPGDNFSFADGLYGAASFCLVDDVRFARGGIFDDTIIAFAFLENAQPSETFVTVEVYDESGLFYGFFTLGNTSSSPLLTDAVSVNELADQVSDIFSIPNNGFLRFFWEESIVGSALTLGSILADDRFQVGFQAACRVPSS